MSKVKTPPTNMNAPNMRNNSGMNSSVPPMSFMLAKPTSATIAPNFPEAAEMPWHVDLKRVGNTSPGIMKVVAFGPKLRNS